MANPQTAFTITSVVSASGVATYTGSITAGTTTPLVLGNAIVITGCTTSGLNGNFTITGGNLTTTFTVANATTVTESETTASAVSPPGSIFTITNVVGVTTTGTYTGTVAGPNLIAGTPITITGCTTANFNGTFKIVSVSTTGGFTTSFTVTIPSTTHTDVSESGAFAWYNLGTVKYNAVPTDVSTSGLGICKFERWLGPLLVVFGNAAANQNISGQGQIYPTGQQ